MRIVVTGASGNLGSALLRRLAHEDVQVTGVSRRAPTGPAGPWVPLDVGDDAETTRLAEALEGADALVHLAWKLQPSHDLAEQEQTNVHGTANVLSAALAAGIGHLVVITSVGAYSPGRKDQRVDETHPVDGVPSSSYSRQKAAVERMLDAVERDHPDVAVARVRPALVFQERAASEIARLFLGPLVPVSLAGRIPLPLVPLPRSMTFQGVHADDVAEAIWAVLQNRAAGPYNVADEPVLTPADLGAAIRALLVVPIPEVALRAVAALTWRLRLQPAEPGWIDLATSVPIMSTDRLRSLGWEPQHTAVAALRELVSGMQQGSGNGMFPPLIPRTERKSP